MLALHAANVSNSDIRVVTNQMHLNAFMQWADENGIRREHVVGDGTSSNDTRLGAIADIQFAINHFRYPTDNWLIVAGDTLLLREVDLYVLLRRIEEMLEDKHADIALCHYQCKSDAEVRKTGILELESMTGRVTGFLEKPDPESTPARNACPCVYMFTPAAIASLIPEFLDEKSNLPLSERDAPGKFLAWVINNDKLKVYSTPIAGRLDVGGLESYIEANEYMK